MRRYVAYLKKRKREGETSFNCIFALSLRFGKGDSKFVEYEKTVEMTALPQIPLLDVSSFYQKSKDIIKKNKKSKEKGSQLDYLFKGVAPVTGICSVLQASHREGRSNAPNT